MREALENDDILFKNIRISSSLFIFNLSHMNLQLYENDLILCSLVFVLQMQSVGTGLAI